MSLSERVAELRTKVSSRGSSLRDSVRPFPQELSDSMNRVNKTSP